MNKIFPLVYLLIFSLTLFGCSTENQPINSSDSSGLITITDALDRQVALEAVPQRLVIAGRGSTLLIDSAYLFPEASARLVSAPAKGGQNISAFLEIIDKDLVSKTVIENEIGPEQLAALKPDVILLKPYLQDQFGKPLEVLGLKVVYLSMETPEEFLRDIQTMGKLFGNENRAAEITDFYKQKQQVIADSLSGIAEGDYPRVLLLYYNDRDGEVAFNVPPLGWIQTTLVKSSAAIPVWQDIEIGSGWTKISFEQIASWDPDQIYIIAYFNNPDEVVAGLKSDPQWQLLSAVENNSLYAFPKDVISWDQADPRWILGLTWLAKTVHPEVFSDLSITAEVQDFFTKMYAMEKQVFDTQLAPMLKGVTP